MPNVLLIGATSAIAQAVAHEYAAQGGQLYLAARSAEKLAVLAADLRARHALEVTCDAFDFDDFGTHAAAIERAGAKLGRIDLALVCYGTLPDQVRCENDPAYADREFRHNYSGPASFLALLANAFELQGSGCLGAISSVAGDRGRKSNYLYGSAKAALTFFLAGLRHRFARSAVHVLTIKPGFVDTPMTAGLRKGLLFASPEKVARDIVAAVRGRKQVLYTPGFWRWIMLVIRLLPAPIFNRLSL